MRTSRHLGIGCLTALSLSFLVGCSSDSRPHDVPSSALRTVEGNQRLVYTAADYGTVWVTEGSDHIIYSSPVASGDRVVLDPEIGKVMLNGQVVADKDVNHNDHKIFQPGTGQPVAVAAGDRPVSRPDGVPMSAIVGGEGKDRVEYTARRDGFVWVTDEIGAEFYSGPINRGDVILVDPQKNHLTVNGRSVYGESLNTNNHRIFFSHERPVFRTEERGVRTTEIPADAVSRLEGTGRMDFVAEPTAQSGSRM